MLQEWLRSLKIRICDMDDKCFQLRRKNVNVFARKQKPKKADKNVYRVTVFQGIVFQGTFTENHLQPKSCCFCSMTMSHFSNSLCNETVLQVLKRFIAKVLIYHI